MTPIPRYVSSDTWWLLRSEALAPCRTIPHTHCGVAIKVIDRGHPLYQDCCAALNKVIQEYPCHHFDGTAIRKWEILGAVYATWRSLLAIPRKLER